jgi:hypothetical protein
MSDKFFTSMHENIMRCIEDDRAESRAYLATFPTDQERDESPTEKISTAREFVRNSKIGSAALRVWRTTLHYHA